VTQRYLFLQGMATPLLAKLGAALLKRGHFVRRVNFNGGDRVFWPLPGAVDYRGDLSGWPKFLSRKLREWGITNIVLFGDCRPLHVEAIRIARVLGVAVHVFEEGYLRPNWVTLEEGGVNANSRLPREPQFYLDAAAGTPAWDGGKPVAGSFAKRAVDDVLYHVARLAMTWRYPLYRTHLATDPFVEYAGWIKRFATLPAERSRTGRQLRALKAAGRPYYVFPLQLDGDSQVRCHSRFTDLEAALETVMTSFARKAPAAASLVVKRHPLDAGLRGWRGVVARKARALGLGERVVYLGEGPLDALLKGSLGVAVINSTVGFLALSYGLPVVALGLAMYDMPSLTFQDGLDRFWTEGATPDARTFDAFRRVIATRAQINGGYFSAQGLEMAVENAVRKLETSRAASAPARAVPAGVSVDKALWRGATAALNEIRDDLAAIGGPSGSFDPSGVSSGPAALRRAADRA
jgi:capsular polysaccharide export protein